ncbi:MAG: family 10 glycosylhydrolase [Leptolyngbya sp. SIOISBB]|nr:family 10 glycosylhydrolase [Leptolyngbya sp. SIOISBB]
MRDIQGHWAQACIEYLVEQEVFAGYPDGTFQPEKAITRAEFAVIASRAFELSAKRPSKQFADVPDDYWAKEVIDQVYRAAWLSGYTNGTFGPGQLMPRVQVLVALASGLDLVPIHPAAEVVKASLTDAATIPQYAISGVAAAVEHRLVVNVPHQNRLRPLDPATRAEAAAFLYQALIMRRGLPQLFAADMIATFEPDRPAELRGVWMTNVDSEVLFSRQNLVEGIDRLVDCGFNTLYPTVWNGGFTLFPSAIAESVLGEKQRLHPGLTRSSREAAQDNRDMLAECLEIAHAKNLRVIPWFEYGFFARRGNSLRSRQPLWFTHQRDGTQTDKHSMEWLNPFRPEVQEFYLALIADLMARYPVDGFQVDDHFGLPVEFGYDAYTTQLYRSETGQSPPRDSGEEHWMRWRADKLTDFVAQVSQTVKQYRPQATFSVSPNPPGFSYRNFLQDWPRWLTTASVDEIIIQTYRWNLSSFVNELQKSSVQSLKTQVPISIGVLAGLRNRPMPLPILKQQGQAVRANGYAGMAFFFYETLWQPADESASLRRDTLKALLKA